MTKKREEDEHEMDDPNLSYYYPDQIHGDEYGHPYFGMDPSMQDNYYAGYHVQPGTQPMMRGYPMEM